MRKFYILSAIFIALFCLCGIAQATTINYTGTSDYMGLVSIGQNGKITNQIMPSKSNPKEHLLGAGFGFLPAMSEIVFSYTFPSTTGHLGHLFADAAYFEKKGSNIFSAFSTTDANGSFSKVFNTNTHHTHNVPSPILALAHISVDFKSGTTTIINNSDVSVAFSSYFFALYCGCTNPGVFATYEVSAIPLPPALIMFLTGLAGLALLGWVKKGRQGSSLAV